MKLSRREFLKLTGLASASSLALGHLSGLGTDAALPAFLKVAGDGEYLTTCDGCPLGCGLVVLVQNSLIAGLQANPSHPLAGIAGSCSLLSGFLSRHFHAERLNGPLKRGLGNQFRQLGWDAAIGAIRTAWRTYQASEIAFLVGLFPDHLFDFARQISHYLGGAHVVRYSAYTELSGWVTLMDATRKLHGLSQVPYFDVANADLVFSFGDQPLDIWRLAANTSAIWVHFSPYRLSGWPETDQWIAIRPGSEAWVAGAIAYLAGEALGDNPGAKVDVQLAAQIGGVQVSELRRLATMYASARRKVAIPGGGVFGQSGGLAAAESVLVLNRAAGCLGSEGGLFLKPEMPAPVPGGGRPNTYAEVKALIERIRSGRIKALFVHGVDPLSELPAAAGLVEALDSLDLLVSFSPVLNRTARRADYILPDHAMLESWGYHRLTVGSNRPGISIWRPLMSPTYDTRAAVDVLLSAVRATGAELANMFPYMDASDFVRQSCNLQVNRPVVSESDFSGWLRMGGWWADDPLILPPVAVGSPSPDALAIVRVDPAFDRYDLWLVPSFSNQDDGDFEVLLNPQVAERLKVLPGQRVWIVTPFGRLEAQVLVSDVVVDGVIGIPVYPSDISGRSGWEMFGDPENQSGNLAPNKVPARLLSAP